MKVYLQVDEYYPVYVFAPVDDYLYEIDVTEEQANAWKNARTAFGKMQTEIENAIKASGKFNE